MEGMEKQTAVEWLFCQSLELTLQLSKRRISHRTWELEMVKISEQAKEMEKAQKAKEYIRGYNDTKQIDILLNELNKYLKTKSK